MNKESFFSKIWKYIKLIKHISDEDSLRGYIVSIILIIVLIKLIILPLLGFVLGGTNYPIVSVVSNSMEHKPTNNILCGYKVDSNINSFDEWWYICDKFYLENNISKDQFLKYPSHNGFYVGDAMVIYKKQPQDIKIGDIIVYIRYDGKPIIHRVIRIRFENNQYIYSTKGDFNPYSDFYEYDIKYNQIQGVAILRLPYVGLPKYWLSKAFGQI